MSSGWLFNELLSLRQKRGKPVNLEEAVQTVERLHLECIWLIRCWAFFEALNGYPTAGHGEYLRDSINKIGEGHGVNVISQAMIREAVSTAFRILEDDSKDRRNLSSIASFLSRVEGSGLTKEHFAPRYLRLPHRKTEWELMIAVECRLSVRLMGKDNAGKRNLNSHRRVIKGFRDHVIAHSMAHIAYEGVAMFQMRDAIVFISACVADALLLLKCSYWGPKVQWRKELNEAKIFWSRYHRGFQ